MAIAYTQEKINEVTYLIYANYYNHFKEELNSRNENI